MKYRKFVQQACSLEALKATLTYKAIEAADKGDLSLLKPLGRSSRYHKNRWI